MNNHHAWMGDFFFFFFLIIVNIGVHFNKQTWTTTLSHIILGLRALILFCWGSKAAGKLVLGGFEHVSKLQPQFWDMGLKKLDCVVQGFQNCTYRSAYASNFENMLWTHDMPDEDHTLRADSNDAMSKKKWNKKYLWTHS